MERTSYVSDTKWLGLSARTARSWDDARRAHHRMPSGNRANVHCRHERKHVGITIRTARGMTVAVHEGALGVGGSPRPFNAGAYKMPLQRCKRYNRGMYGLVCS